jgi:hypothetical protein
MAIKSLEESIRELSTIDLEDIVENRSSDYTEEGVRIAHEELTIRRLKKLNGLEQIDYIKGLADSDIAFIVERCFNKYPGHLLAVAQKEYTKRGLESPEWYYLENNNTIGPIKFSELKNLTQSGIVFSYSFVFKEGLPNWITANNVPGLFTFNQVNTNLPPPPINFPTNPGPGMLPFNAFPIYQQEEEEETLSGGMAFLCFFIPLIGIIMYFSHENKKGKAAGSCALWGFVIGMIVCFILYSMTDTAVVVVPLNY